MASVVVAAKGVATKGMGDVMNAAASRTAEKIARGARRVAAALLCSAVLVLGLAAPALARDADATGGNVISFGETGSSLAASPVKRDLCWFGQTLDASTVTIGSDLIAAGQTINVRGGTVGGSVRAAGQTVALSGVTVTNNITAAGESVSVGTGTTSAGVYLAGKAVDFSGTAQDLRIGAQNVVISGTVTGDVSVDAESVTVTSSAKITGNLTVRAASEPSIASGAQVTSMDYTRVTKDSDASPSASSSGFGLAGGIYLVVVFCLIALILTWILPVATDGAAAMVRQRTAPMLVTGLVGMLAVIPVTIVLLLVAPLAGALVGAVLAVFLVAAPFAGASVMRLIVPGWNRFGAAAVGGAVAGLLASIPYVRTVFVAAAFIYLLGYVLQCIYLGMRAPSARELEEHGHDDGCTCGHDHGHGEGEAKADLPVPPEVHTPEA